MSKILTQNIHFQGHLSTFEAQNTPKSRLFEAKNNAQTLPKQLQNNFEKVQKSTFLTPQNGQNSGVNMAKSVDFWVHFRSTISKIAFLAPKKK